MKQYNVLITGEGKNPQVWISKPGRHAHNIFLEMLKPGMITDFPIKKRTQQISKGRYKIVK